MKNWSPHFWLNMASLYATQSNDPSMKVGAVIVRPDRTAVSFGCNGFPTGVEDTPLRLNHRETKLTLTLHAETNAILFSKEPVAGYTLLSTFCPCVSCAMQIIQSRIAKVYFRENNLNDRWRESQAMSIAHFHEAGIEVVSVTELGVEKRILP